MARPLRIEFPGALYHVTSRGNRREPIFTDDTDRHALLGVVARAMERFDAVVLSYCLMGNHCHFVMHTRQANLLRLMRHVNGVMHRASTGAMPRPATCSRAASSRSWSIATTTCWSCAALSN